MNAYERIERVIHYLDQHQREQPDLAELADYVGLSPSHFHRLFTAWAGVSPKEFLQCLTLSHARSLLQRGHSVLDAALDSGLSGPGRLHDLCVKLTAATPGEVKTGGKHMSIVFGLADSPFGTCQIAESPRGICHLAFVEPADGQNAPARLVASWPNATYHRDDTAAMRLAGRVFKRPGCAQSRPRLRAYVNGTRFQLQVWRALLHLGAGSLISYGELAQVLGRPGAARSIGAAVGKNPIAYLIPCHRVIRETGAISRYRWGAQRKRIMLAWDSATSPKVQPVGTSIEYSTEDS